MMIKHLIKLTTVPCRFTNATRSTKMSNVYWNITNL